MVSLHGSEGHTDLTTPAGAGRSARHTPVSLGASFEPRWRGTDAGGSRSSGPSPSGGGYLYGQRFYPTAPLSWLAPLWFFVCGAAASGEWAASLAWDGVPAFMGDRILRLLAGLLLVGPLLGAVWAASTQIMSGGSLARSVADSLSTGDPDVRGTKRSLPYTLPGSLGHRLAVWLSERGQWWRQWLALQTGNPVLQGFVGSVFALTLAGQAGQLSLVLTAVVLFTALIRAVVHGKYSSSRLLSLAFPLFAAWLLGHAAYNPLNVASVVIALCFALAFYSFSAPSAALRGRFADSHQPATRPNQGMIWQVLAVTCLILIGQPIAAATTALLATPQLLLCSLLKTESERYFRAIQFQLMLIAFLTALALGYRP